MINKISDIEIGKEYFIALHKGIKTTRKAIVKTIINEKGAYNPDRTELYIRITAPKRLQGTTLIKMKAIGIGETKAEALANFGRFDYEDHPSFSDKYVREYSYEINQK